MAPVIRVPTPSPAAPAGASVCLDAGPKRLPGLHVSTFHDFPMMPQASGSLGLGPGHPLETTCQVPDGQPTKQDAKDGMNTERGALCVGTALSAQAGRGMSNLSCLRPSVSGDNSGLWSAWSAHPTRTPSPPWSACPAPRQVTNGQEPKGGAGGWGDYLDRHRSPFEARAPQEGSTRCLCSWVCGARAGRCHGYRRGWYFLKGQLGGAAERVAAAPCAQRLTLRPPAV